MKKLFIFDLDGTLSDTRPLLNFVFADALTECGFPETEDHIRALVRESGYMPTKDGAHVPVAYRDKVPDNFGLYFWTNYENYFMGAEERLYDGIRETLDELKARGHTVAILSNKPHRYTERIINKTFGEGYFALVLGGTPELEPKPSPAGLLYICKMLGFKPEDTYMIGDLTADYRSAQGASSNFIGAGWGYDPEGLRSEGAEAIANAPLDILGMYQSND